MNLEERLESLQVLQDILTSKDEYIDANIKRTFHANGWMTKRNYDQSIKAITDHFLDAQALRSWFKEYHIPEKLPRRIGIIMAANLPLVGFQDLLCVFVAGDISVLKCSSKDPYVIPAIIKQWGRQCPEILRYFEFPEKLENLAALIATGSNNSARHFEYYFNNIPRLIRSHRNSLAVLNGHESSEEIDALAQDVYSYYGLGCRNVALLWLPKGYDVTLLKDRFEKELWVVENEKYRNNFEYNLAISVMNRTPMTQWNNILLFESSQLHSRIATLHYSFYDDLEEVKQWIRSHEEKIQVVISNIDGLGDVNLGEGQEVKLQDYADKIDVMDFLFNQHQEV